MIRKFLLNIVSKLIELVEIHELRHLPLDEHDSSKKIIETLPFSETEYLTKSDTGWHPIANLFRLQPYTEWKLETVSGKQIICADHHLLFTPDYKVIRTDRLYAGDQILTVDGVEEVKYCYPTNRKSSMYDCEIMSSDHRYFTNDILSHNTVTSSLFITWYLLFNVDKNVIVLANKGGTAAEILDKIKAVFKGLPFFLKPGIITNNVMTMKFDNGCRVMGQATTKTAAIGFTLHLVYMDEFAHIQASFLEPFYRSVYPTISSSQISRVIITSTPHGRNKFWEIYQGAVEKRNEYNPLRVDWWQVPGRDEAWKRKEIANLGSEELFNQEYGNQFLAGDTLLLGGDALRAMKKRVREYVWKQLEDFEFEDVEYKDLKWHPEFNPDTISSDERFVLSIDIADGAGKDYSVINIFKVEPMSLAAIRKLRRDRVEDESGMFRLRQIGVFRSNKADADVLSKITDVLVFKLFGEDNVRIALEMNFKGDYFVEKLTKNENFYEEIFLHTKHNMKNIRTNLGIKLGPHNKMFFCREFRKMVLEKRIVLNEKITFDEMNDFGVNSRGSYSSQSGHDDVAMTCVNLVPYITSDAFAEQVEELHDSLDDNVKKTIQAKLLEADVKKDDSPVNLLKDLMQ